MEAHFSGFRTWVQAVGDLGTTDTDEVRDAMFGQTVPDLTGVAAEMLAKHRLAKPDPIGEIEEDGRSNILKQTCEAQGDAWAEDLTRSAMLPSN